MTPSTHTVHALAIELGRDVRLVQRALAGIPPDDVKGRRKGWRLVTALAALEAHGVANALRGNGSNGGRSKGGGSSDLGVVDELERATLSLQTALDQLAAEPSISKRRDRAKDIGPLLVRFGDALDASGDLLPPHTRELTQPARDGIRGQMAGAVLATLRSALGVRLVAD